MSDYTQVVDAISNSVADTPDTFIDITAPASTSIILKEVGAYTKDATTRDDTVTVYIYRQATSGSGSAAGSPKATRPLAPAAVATTKIKNGSTAFALGGTQTLIRKFSFNGRTPFVMPVEIESASAGIISIVVERHDTSVGTVVEARWSE